MKNKEPKYAPGDQVHILLSLLVVGTGEVVARRYNPIGGYVYDVKDLSGRTRLSIREIKLIEAIDKKIFFIDQDGIQYKVVYYPASNCTDFYRAKEKDWFCRKPATKCENFKTAKKLLQIAL